MSFLTSISFVPSNTNRYISTEIYLSGLYTTLLALLVIKVSERRWFSIALAFALAQMNESSG